MDLQAQLQQGSAIVAGTVIDGTGAVIRGASVQVLTPDQHRTGAHEVTTGDAGGFLLALAPGRYVIRIEAPGFAPFTSRVFQARADTHVQLPVRLQVASLHQEISVLEKGGDSTAPDAPGAGVVLEGDQLALLSNDAATLRQQLSMLAGGFGTPRFMVDGFSGAQIPPKAAIRSISINRNPYSPYYDDLSLQRVEISTQPGTDKLHGALNLSGTEQALDAPNPYTTVRPPFYDFEQDGNLSGPIDKDTSYFFSETVENLANSSVVNAADPEAPTQLLSTYARAPQLAQVYSLRVDRRFNERNFAYVRDEWSQTHILNSGIQPLVLPEAAYSSNVLTNTLQLSDTQMLGAHAVNDTRFQYTRTRLRQDPNQTRPSVLVQSTFQSGGAPTQVLQDNQDAYEAQDRLEMDRGHHALRLGFRFRALRDANESSAGFNGQYIFPDVAAYLAGVATQYSQSFGQQGAVLRNDDLGVYAEDNWTATPNLTLSYGLRFESESAIPDHSDPAPRVGFAYAVKPGKRQNPIVTLRGGYGVFYDRFPAAQLLQAVRQNGVRQVAFVAQDVPFSPVGPPLGVALSAAQPTAYQVDSRLRSMYTQAGSFTVSRAFEGIGLLNASFLYAHISHGYLARNANAPLPGTYDPAQPGSGTRPLGTDENLYQFTSAANGNLERFTLGTRLQYFGGRLSLLALYRADKNYVESDGVDHFTANPYDLRRDYARAAVTSAQNLSMGVVWNGPRSTQSMLSLVAHSGMPFDVTTGTDLNGDTVYNDRPAMAAGTAGSSIVTTGLGSFNVQPAAGQSPLQRNYGTAPPYFWTTLRESKDFHLGPRPSGAAAAADAGQAAAPAERPWVLTFGVEVHNVTNHNNPGLPVGILSAQPCGSAHTAPCACPVRACGLAPSQYFGHSLSMAADFSPITASNRTILLQTSFTF